MASQRTSTVLFQQRHRRCHRICQRRSAVAEIRLSLIPRASSFRENLSRSFRAGRWLHPTLFNRSRRTADSSPVRPRQYQSRCGPTLQPSAAGITVEQALRHCCAYAERPRVGLPVGAPCPVSGRPCHRHLRPTKSACPANSQSAADGCPNHLRMLAAAL